MEKKYIICDYARANWGKTETLLEVISLLKGKPQSTLIYEKPNTGKDKWCHFEMKGKPVVISTLGDPYSAQPAWLEDATNTGAEIIVTASRTSGSTVNAVYDIATRYGYEVIWFQNFHFDNSALVGLSSMVDVRMKLAECIVGIIDLLL
ncbi:MAG: hypothetical protein IKN78_05725 [Bacteroidales bacterium]|nr:hypothetical protein [Bacteroidales bacterium]